MDERDFGEVDEAIRALGQQHLEQAMFQIELRRDCAEKANVVIPEFAFVAEYFDLAVTQRKHHLHEVCRFI